MTIGERSGTGTSTWLHADDCSVDDFRAIVEVTTDGRDYPHAADVVDNVLVYDCDRLRAEITTPAGRRSVQAELVVAMADGPGLVVFAGAFPDTSIVDRVTDVFVAIIADQHAAGQAAGDHYAKPGANDRIWNALEKLALRDPDAFVDYYGNEIIELVSSAWLGPELPDHVAGQRRQPGRRRPGSPPRLPPRVPVRRGRRAVPGPRPPVVGRAHAAGRGRPHRHAGRERSDDVPAALAEVRARLPRLASSRLRRVLRRTPRPAPARQGRRGVLQPGAVPRRRSQPVTSDIKRMANLLQVSSAFGRAMETVDREAMSNALFPALVAPGAGRRSRGPAAQRDRGRRPRATRSRPTSTAINRSADWPPRPRPSSCGGP